MVCGVGELIKMNLCVCVGAAVRCVVVSDGSKFHAYNSTFHQHLGFAPCESGCEAEVRLFSHRSILQRPLASFVRVGMTVLIFVIRSFVTLSRASTKREMLDFRHQQTTTVQDRIQMKVNCIFVREKDAYSGLTWICAL